MIDLCLCDGSRNSQHRHALRALAEETICVSGALQPPRLRPIPSVSGPPGHNRNKSCPYPFPFASTGLPRRLSAPALPRRQPRGRNRRSLSYRTGTLRRTPTAGPPKWGAAEAHAAKTSPPPSPLPPFPSLPACAIFSQITSDASPLCFSFSRASARFRAFCVGILSRSPRSPNGRAFRRRFSGFRHPLRRISAAGLGLGLGSGLGEGVGWVMDPSARAGALRERSHAAGADPAQILSEQARRTGFACWWMT